MGRLASPHPSLHLLCHSDVRGLLASRFVLVYRTRVQTLSACPRHMLPPVQSRVCAGTRACRWREGRTVAYAQTLFRSQLGALWSHRLWLHPLSPSRMWRLCRRVSPLHVWHRTAWECAVGYPSLVRPETRARARVCVCVCVACTATHNHQQRVWHWRRTVCGERGRVGPQTSRRSTSSCVIV